MMHSLTAVLLPCIVSGYAFVSANLVQLHLHDKPGANDYFRILLTGFLWFGICIVAAFLLSEDEHSLAGFTSFFADSLMGSSAYLFGYGSTFVAITIRLFLDWSYHVLRNDEETYLESFLRPFLHGRGKNMEIFLAEAVSESHLVEFVMKNDHVYVAWISFVGTLKDSPEWLNLYLVASGHVDRESRAATIAKPLLAETAMTDRQARTKVCVAVREIVSMQFLDPKLLQSGGEAEGKAA